FLDGAVPVGHYYLYGFGTLGALALIFLTALWKYNATYFTTYRESGVRRIRLAEKLRKLPLSFFGKKDLADLTNTVMGDCATTEQMMSHYVPQFWGSIISTCIIAASMFAFDWRLALAALWILPVTLVVVALSKKAQVYFTGKQTEAQIAVEDGIQECLETVRDLKSNNAEKKYLQGLNKKIERLEGRHIKSELGSAMFVVPSSMILKLGIVTVALVGSMLLINGSLTLVTFFMFMLVVSRIYEPMTGALQNLAAMNSLQVNIDRINEMENTPERGGSSGFAPDGYDIKFDNVGFAYNAGETVLSGVSFTAKQGEVTALIGESGGGKSTAAKLAARFWDVNEGTVRVGGVDVATVDPETLLSDYTEVFQDVVLFNGTVMEN
ncbi:MAG: ABC transporter ATP-binding protein/permease, partial [Clostridia bacterium]|nr:ABC transporter ATP-binding protein/permease [Clostridia bacterium]